MGVTDVGRSDGKLSWRVVACRNLRPGLDGSGRRVLRSVGRPKPLATADQCEPDDGQPRPPVAAADCHGIELRAVDATLASAEIPGRKLSRAYPAGENALDHADHNNVTADLVRAYRTLARSAAADGMYLQPAIGRCKLYDASRRLLYTSPPVLLGHSQGPQCTDAMMLRSLDRQTIEPHQITAKCWRPQVVLPASGLSERVAYVELWMTPQLHGFDAGATAAIAMVRNGTAEFLRVQFPGVYTALSASHPQASHALLGRVLAALPRLERSVAELPAAPYSTTTVNGAPERSLAAEQRQLASGLQRTAKGGDTVGTNLPQLLTPPHSFTAAHVACGPVGVLWGGISAMRYGGYPLTAFTADMQPKRWSAWIAVDFDEGGERVVWQGGGESNAPRRLQPMLSYPSADARRMTVQLSVEGQAVQRGTFELTPVGAANLSVYVHPSLSPFALDAADGAAQAAPASVTVPHEYPDCVAVAPAAEPHRLQALLNPGLGQVLALAASGGSQSAWDFGRPRFYAFCHRGIVAVSATASLNRLAATPVDTRRVSGPRAVCRRDGQVVAVASGDLLQLNGNRAATLRTACGYTAVGWVGSRNELIGQRGDGSLEYTVYAGGDTTGQRFDVDWRQPDGQLTTDARGRVLYVTPTAVYDLGDESGSGGVDAKWQVEVSAPTAVAPTALDVNIGAEHISGTVSLTRRHLLASETRGDAGLILNGRLTAPLHLSLRTRPATGWLFDLTARVSGATVNAVSLGF